jgi:diguanylate cyclase (GGDEF)-like protein/PAS domain S-box-containing protein
MYSYMGVVRPLLSRWVAWLTSVALAGAAILVRAGLVAAASISGMFELLGQKVESRRAAAALHVARTAKHSNRWKAAFEAAPLGMAKVSPEGRLEEVNAAFCTLLGEPERALIGRRLSALVYPDDLQELAGPGDPGKARVAKAEVRLLCAGGRLRWCELASSLMRDRDGRPRHVLVYVVDITRHKRSQAALRDLATRDPLSGLANRRWFELQLAQHLRTCTSEGPRGALVVLDLDNFKRVNDTLGHQAGDRLVIEVALTLRRHLRDRDVVARLGGDEFAVVLHDGDRFAAESVARKLVLAVRDEVDTGTGGVTVSVGVAPFELPVNFNARDALRSADAAMYEVKRSGRNGYAMAGSSYGPHHARSRADLTARAEWAERTGRGSSGNAGSGVPDLSVDGAGEPTEQGDGARMPAHAAREAQGGQKAQRGQRADGARTPAGSQA